jgi:RNA polymerase sigma-70 factor, ECF subfamily
MSHKDDKNAAFFRVYNSVQIKLYALLLMMTHNEKDAEDLLQETAAILWEKFDEFKEGTNFRAWAFVVARNRACLFLKKEKRSPFVFPGDLYEEIMAKSQDHIDEPADRINALKQCMKKLSEVDSMLLRLRYRSNVPTVRISELLGRPINSVYKSLSRIHTLLRQCISRNLQHQDI